MKFCNRMCPDDSQLPADVWKPRHLLGFDNNGMIIQMQYSNGCGLRYQKRHFTSGVTLPATFAGKCCCIYSSSLKTRAIMGFQRGLQTLMTQGGGLHRINCQQKLRSFVRQRIRNENPREERPSDFRFNYLDHIKLFFLGFANTAKALRKFFQNGSDPVCFCQTITYITYI